MKKMMSYLLLGSLLLVISSCNNANNSSIRSNAFSSTGSESSMSTIEEGNIKLASNTIEFKFDNDNGSLVSIINKSTNTDFIKDSVGGNWAMLVDTTTTNPFLSNHQSSNAVLLSSRMYTPTISLNDDTLTLSYHVSFTRNEVTISGIEVNEVITLHPSEDFITIDYEVVNQATSDLVIVNFTGGILSGIKDPTNTKNLFWPNKEGKIYENALSLFRSASGITRLSEQYPSPVSMQLMQLYDEKEALYYIVEDKTAEYKEFNFGTFTSSRQHDYKEVTASDKISMSVTQYPFIKPQQTKALHRVKIGISNNQSWYGGANLYRDFLSTSNMVKKSTPMVQNWTGFIGDTIANYGNGIRKKYDDFNGSNSVLASIDQIGIDTVTLFGWHQGGFDSMYPDYEFFTGEGFGEDGFKILVDRIHGQGDYIIPYINGHIADVNSKWANQISDLTRNISNILDAAIKTRGFNPEFELSKYENYMLLETYGTGTSYYAMCPGSISFQNALNGAVQRLANQGVDGIWFDQVMEMPGNLCFDESHHHETPASAYGEGYREMFSKFDQSFRAANIDDYLFYAEGTMDAYLEFIDIPAYKWGRKLAAIDDVSPGDGKTMSPEITKYTFPAKFLGIDGVNTSHGDLDQLSRAFVFGSPIKYLFGMNPIINDMIRIYENNKDIFMAGRYMDRVGLQLSNDELISSIIVSQTQTSLAVQVYNQSSSNLTNIQVSIDLSRLGLNKVIGEIKDLFTNESLVSQDGKFTINLDSKATKSYKITLN